MNVKEEEDKPSLSLYECCPNLKWVDLFATPCGIIFRHTYNHLLLRCYIHIKILKKIY